MEKNQPYLESIKEYQDSRFNISKLSKTIDFLKNESFFNIGDKQIDEETTTALLNKISDLRFINCTEGCYHQCNHCIESASSIVKHIDFDKFKHEIDVLKKLKEISGLKFSYKKYDVTTHTDGDTMMYLGQKSTNDSRKMSSYQILKYFIDSKLFDSDIAGRNRFQLFTSGWYDIGDKTITNGAKEIVDNCENIFGYDEKTGEPGNLIISFGTYLKYFHNGEKLNKWWNMKLIEMFSLVKPLLEKKILKISIKYSNTKNIGEKDIDLYSAENQLRLLYLILKASGYSNIDGIISDNSILRIRPAYKEGRAKSLNIPLLTKKEYISSYYPKEFSSVRQNTKYENILTIDGKLLQRNQKSEESIDDHQQIIYNFYQI